MILMFTLLFRTCRTAGGINIIRFAQWHTLL